MKIQSISKENLKKIYDVACPSWRVKLENYAKREIFGSDVTLSDDEVTEMFDASDEKQKKVLSKYLSKPKNIIDCINSFEDACVSLGITDSQNEINIMKSLSTPNKDKLIALYRLEIIIKALNQGWYPNFDASYKYKYFNYFKKDNEGVFSFCIVDFNSANMGVPSALYLKTSELAEHCAKIALDDYETLYK